MYLSRGIFFPSITTNETNRVNRRFSQGFAVPFIKIFELEKNFYFQYYFYPPPTPNPVLFPKYLRINENIIICNLENKPFNTEHQTLTNTYLVLKFVAFLDV